MNAVDLVYVTAFGCTGAATLGYGWMMRRRGVDVIGTPAIQPTMFRIGKGSMFGCWMLACLEAAGIRTSWWQLPDLLHWAGAGVIALGTAGTLASYRALGTSLRMGLPRESTELKTEGIFRFSRNPFYASFLLLSAAAVLHSPSPWSLLLAVAGATVHHRIIQGEERFLADRFGAAWQAYAQRVRRYF